MTVILGQILFTSFVSSGFQSVASPSVPTNVEELFRQRVVEAHWDYSSPPPKGWRAAYLMQFNPSQTTFGWAYHDGRDEYGRDHVPYFFGYYLGVPLNQVTMDLILVFLGKGPGPTPSRQSFPPKLEDIVAPELWSYVPLRPGVLIDNTIRENIYRSLDQRSSVELFMVPTPEPIVLDFDEQICDLLALLLAPYLGRQAKTTVQQVVSGTASLLEPKQRVLQVVDRLAAALDDEISKAEFTRRVKAVLGIVGPQG